MRPVEVNSAISSLSGLFRRLLGASIKLEFNFEEPECRIRIDPVQFDRMLVNLAVNARDAMPSGGQLTFRTSHITLRDSLVRGLQTIPSGRYVKIEIQDAGMGIPPDVLPHIFEPFFTTRRDRGGSGLGLSTVHGIVRESEGLVAIDSVVGIGTDVRIYLPRDDERVIPTTSSGSPAAPAIFPEVAVSIPQRGSILVVDDEAGLRRLAVRALTKAGWTVLDAGSGEIALSLLAHASTPAISAILSDVTMPGMDGLTLIRATRSLYPGIPAILTSGFIEESVRDTLAADSIEFMTKPYSLKLLVTTVDTLIACQHATELASASGDAHQVRRRA